MSTTTDIQSIIVNGERRDVQAGLYLSDVLGQMQIDPEHARGVAVAVNEEVVPRRRWAAVAIHDGDRIEIVTAKQGG